MTIALANSAEGQTNGTAATTADTGGASGNAFTVTAPTPPGSITFSSLQSHLGSLSYNMVTGSGGGTGVMTWGSTLITSSPTTMYGQIYLFLNALPATSLRFAKILATGGSVLGEFDINTAGKVVSRDSSGTTVKTSTAVVPIGQWVRIAWKVVSSASVGLLEFKMYLTDPDETTPDETQTSTAAQNTGGGACTSVQWGALISIANFNGFFDDFAFSDTAYPAATGTPGAPSPGVPINLVNDAEEGTNGTAVNATNSAGAGENAFQQVTANGSITFSDAEAKRGANSFLLSTGPTAATNVLQWGSAVITSSPTTVYGQIYLFMPTLPSATVRLVKFLAGSSFIGAIDVSAAGNIISRDANAATIQTSATALPIGQWVRVAYKFVSSATVGLVEFKIYSPDPDAASPNETKTSAASQNTGGGAITTNQIGQVTSIASWAVYLDDVAFSDTAYPAATGSPSTTPPTALVLTNDAESQASGVNVTAVDSGGGSDTPFSTVTPGTGSVIYDSSRKAHGNNSFLISTGASSSAVTLAWGSAVITSAPTEFFMRAYVYLPQLPPTTLRLFKAQASGATLIGEVDINANGTVSTRGNAGTVLDTTTTVIPTGQWVRIEAKYISHATAGQVEVKLFTTDADNPTSDADETQTSALTDTAGGPITLMQVGALIGIAGYSFSIDDVAFNDSVYPGPSGAVGSTRPKATTGFGILIRVAEGGAPVLPPPSGVVHSPVSAIAVDGETKLGYYQGGNLFAPQQAFEGVIGRQFSIHKFYVDMSTTSSGIPSQRTNDVVAAAAVGPVHLALSGNVWSGASAALVSPQPAGPVSPSHPWFGLDDAIAGALDPVFEQWATSIGSMAPTIFLVDWYAEIDATARTQNAKTAPNLFPAALSRLIGIFNSMGVTNVEFCWTMSGFQSSQTLYQQLWGDVGGSSPLDSLVTHICWDPYIDGSGQGATKYLNFWNEVQGGMLTPAAKNKYFGLSEWGVGQGGEDRGPIFASVPATVADKLHFMEYWDGNVGTGYKNYQVASSSDDAIAAFTSMAALLD